MCDARRSPRRRNAFTLIELIVVMALIVVLFGLVAGYAVFGQGNQHSVTATNAVTGAMLNAKQRARRDGVPTGIRILFGTGKDVNGNPVATWAAQIVLVQQPEDYTAGQIQAAVQGTTTLTFNNVDFQGGAAYMGEIDQSTVEAGDYFVLQGGLPHLINQVAGAVGGPQTLTLASAVERNVNQGDAYAIVRGPRRLASEDVIQLPPDIVIDNSAYAASPYNTQPNGLCQNLPLRSLIDMNNPAPGQPAAEIVFAPSGAVVGQGTTADKVLLWLRDPSLSATAPIAGAPAIVSIQIRTGLLSVYPVAAWNTPADDPYLYAKDGRASGM